MPLDLKQFAADFGLSPEDQTTLYAIFDKNPQIGDKLTGLMTSQVQAALQPLQADLERKSKDLDDQFATLESVRGTDSATLDAANKRVEAAAQQVTLAQERIKRMATDFGVDPSPWLADLTPPEASKVQPPPKIDTPMDGSKILATAGVQAWNALRSSAELQDIAQEHATLFGKPLANSLTLLDQLQEKVKRTGNGNITLRDIWNEAYKVDDKRKELQEADVKRRETEAYERGKREAADAAALGTAANQAPPPFVQSPVLAQLTKDAPARVSGVPEGVVAAIADYRQRRLNSKTA